MRSLDDNVVAMEHELARASGRQCDAVLVLLDFFDDTYAHEKYLRDTIRTGNLRMVSLSTPFGLLRST
jgi:hypothetical protein